MQIGKKQSDDPFADMLSTRQADSTSGVVLLALKEEGRERLEMAR